MRPLRNIPVAVWLMLAVVVAAIASHLAGGGVPSGRRASTPEPVPVAAEDPELRESPAGVIAEAWEAARSGDLDRYLSHFDEPLRSQLLRLRQEQGDAALRDYLRRSCERVYNFAIREYDRREVAPGEFLYPVDFVLGGDQREEQGYVLKRIDGRWRIVRLEVATRGRLPIPFGTPIEQAPMLPGVPPPPPERPR